MINLLDHDELDSAAGEFVLGTLSYDEREEIKAALETAPFLRKAVGEWETRLLPLLADTAEATPSAEVFYKIEQRLFHRSPRREIPREISQRAQSNLWRPVAVAAAAASVVLLGLLLQLRPNSVGVGSLDHLAVLQKDPLAPVFLISFNEPSATLRVQTATTLTPPRDKSFQLWLVADALSAPRSLGVLPTDNQVQIKLPQIDPALVSHATLAISVEPLGGSPTGAPTGPVVFTGKFVDATL